jgi:hypothetical protein
VAALPQTRWSAVARACDRDGETWQEALAAILLIYRPVLLRHLICNQRMPPDRAEDLVQMFLADKILEQNVLRQASPAKGRLRSFVLKVFCNFVAGRLRGQRALKRRPSSPDAERLDDLPETASGDLPVPETFDMSWARQVISLTKARMEKTCLAEGRRTLWDVLNVRILLPVFEGAAPMPYEELVMRFGLRSPSEASNLLITAKRMFARTLREVVRETVSDDREVEAEVRELKRILSK